MTRLAFLDIVYGALRQYKHDDIKDVTQDNDNDSGEIIVDFEDGTSRIIRSSDLDRVDQDPI